MVATPIGNLADLSLRALHVLGLVDAIACEDTRHTAGLLQAFGLHKPLLALHQHNEREAAQQVIERLRRGERVAFVSDAGTPGVSDPGARLVAAVPYAALEAFETDSRSRLYFKVLGFNINSSSRAFFSTPSIKGSVPVALFCFLVSANSSSAFCNSTSCLPRSSMDAAYASRSARVESTSASGPLPCL